MTCWERTAATELTPGFEWPRRIIILEAFSDTWIVPVLYLILKWVLVTLVVVRAGAAPLSRTVALA
jgi:hypothetical protein